MSRWQLCLPILLASMSAVADPPPDSCGGHCQAICINGCDANHEYSALQARCVGPLLEGLYPTMYLSDAKGRYCNDGYTCDFGPCGRPGERACNTATVHQGFYTYQGQKIRLTGDANKACQACDEGDITTAAIARYDAATAKCVAK